MVARYILCFLWGATLASGWWAVAMFDNPKIGPSEAPALLLFTLMMTTVTLGVVVKVTFDSAIKGKE